MRYDQPPRGFSLVTYEMCFYGGVTPPFGPIPQDKAATVPQIDRPSSHDYHLGSIIEDFPREEEIRDLYEDEWSEDELSRYGELITEHRPAGQG